MILRYPYITATLFIWIGFICAISFMESWLKFKAPGVTVPLGLGIGRLVFGALNKVEWILGAIIIINFWLYRDSLFSSKYILFCIPLLILIVQTFWLLPALDARADVVIKGAQPPASYLHIYFVVAEVIKLSTLFLFSTKFYTTA